MNDFGGALGGDGGHGKECCLIIHALQFENVRRLPLKSIDRNPIPGPPHAE